MAAIIPEILALAHNAATDKQRREILLNPKFNTPALRFILRLTYSPWINFTIPFPTDIKMTDRPAGLLLANLNGEYKRLLIFTDLETRNVTVEKKSAILKAMLSAIHPSEVKLLEFVWQKNLPVNGLSRELVANLFPGILDIVGYKYPNDYEPVVTMELGQLDKISVTPASGTGYAETKKKGGRPFGAKTVNRKATTVTRQHGPDGKFLPAGS